MPTFPTPTPTRVNVKISFGGIQFMASDRDDTVVTVRPTNPSRQADIAYAEDTIVELVDGVITVVGPRGKAIVLGPSGAIDVTVELPTGSAVTATAPASSIRTKGALGDVHIKTSAGSISVEHATSVDAVASAGDIAVDIASGDVDVTVDTGSVRLGTIGGAARIKNSHGGVRIAEVGGELSARTASGAIEVDRAGGSVAAASTYGGIRLGEVSHGTVRVDGGYGQVEVGVREGVAVWLDAATKSGAVRNELQGSEPPAAGAPAVELRARTGYGDILVRRAR